MAAPVGGVDADLGIISVSLRRDFTGLADTYERSAAVRDGAVANFSKRKLMLEDTHLSPDFELSVLLTITLGAPNSTSKLYAVDVTVGEAEALLPASLPIKSPTGKGPILEVFVGLPRAVARFGWDDAKAKEFYAVFSGTDLNKIADLGRPMNQGELEKIAKAFALREFMRYRDHPEGGITTTLRPNTKLSGTISSITHSVSPGQNGGGLTTVELLGPPPAVDAIALMPADVRRAIEGYVQP